MKTRSLTETLDSAEFHVIYDEKTNMWDIVDSLDEDGYRQCGIKPEDKQRAMQDAYEFVLDNIFRKKVENKLTESEVHSIYINPLNGNVL